MKKLILVSIIFSIICFGCSKNTSSDDVSGIGYEKVAWGTSIQDVNNYYPLPELLTHGTPHELEEFVQGFPSGSIRKRTFKFYQNKLYMVEVDYDGDAVGNIADKVNELLVSKYGEFDNTKDTTTPGWEDIIKSMSFYRYYHQRLTIIHEIDKQTHYTSSTVYYIDPIIYNQIIKTKEDQTPKL